MYLGTDLIYVPRIRRLIDRYGETGLLRLLCVDELEYCHSHSGRRRPFENMVAARLAVKEAVAKALGVGLNGLGYGDGINWTDVETCSIYQHPPQLCLHGWAKQWADDKVQQWSVSWSHDGDYALATVCGWAK